MNEATFPPGFHDIHDFGLFEALSVYVRLVHNILMKQVREPRRKLYA